MNCRGCRPLLFSEILDEDDRQRQKMQNEIDELKNEINKLKLNM